MKKPKCGWCGAENDYIIVIGKRTNKKRKEFRCWYCGNKGVRF